MKRNLLVLGVMIAAVLFLTPHNAEAYCPEDPNDLGKCDTLYVETFDCDHIYEAEPGSFDSVRVAIYVTHDSNTFWWAGENKWVQDSISAFTIPLTFWHEPPGCADSVFLPNWDSWNNTYISPGHPLMNRSMFRHIVDTHTGDTTYNRLLQMVENWKEAWDVIIDIDPYSCDGDSGHVFFSVVPLHPNCQKWWEGSRVLLATLTFHVYMSEDCDTTEIGIDSTFWPPYAWLSFVRYDAESYYPRHFLPVKDTIYLPVNVPGDNCDLPIEIDLPADLPFSELGQTTCGRVDDYDNTCLGYYDGGEDIIYKLNVSEAVDVDIEVDPKTTSYTGIALDDACPPGDPCMEYSTASSGSYGLYNVHLDPGTYYIMIDNWPSPDCISDFDLTITEHPECGWVSFDGSPPLTPPDVEVIGCDPSQTVICIRIHGMCVEDTTVGTETFKLITGPEMTSTLDYGRPRLPALGEMIGLSTLAELVTVTDISTSAPLTFENLHIFPLQVPKEGLSEPPFVMDSSFYSDSNYFYPSSVAQAGPVGFWHILPISNIGIFPFQYNPVTDTLIVYDSVCVTLSHPGSPVIDTIPRSFTVLYETLINHECVFQNVPQDMKKFEADKLMILADTIPLDDPSIKELEESLKKRRIKVKKMKASEAGGSPPTPDSLKGTIREFAKGKRKVYVDLIGDHSEVPPKVGTFGLGPGAGGLGSDDDILSDQWYELVKGEDYIPDVSVGRIPTSDPATLATIINKKIKNNNTAHPNITKILLVASKQDPVCRKTKKEIQKKLDLAGFTVIEAYGADSATNDDVKKALEEDSVGQVNYVGHGSAIRWSHWAHSCSSWTKDDIDSLDVTCHEPIIWSTGCDNNKIDHTEDCIGEHWIKTCKATAVFGPSRRNFIDPSVDLDRFIFGAECWFKDRCKNPDLGDVIQMAKKRLVTWYWDDEAKDLNPCAKKTILEYLLLGDPDQTKWTKFRGESDTDHPPNVPAGGGGKSQEFPVSVECEGSPVEGAIVSLWKEGVEEDEVFEALYTDFSGEAIFDIDPQTPGILYVTVWGRGLKVYFGEVPVYICGDVNADGTIDIGDVIYLINYLFTGTSAPNPLCAGDVNCDGVVDVGDVVYLINYLFTGTSPPCSECCDLKAKMEEFPGQKMERVIPQRRPVPQKLPKTLEGSKRIE